MDVDVTFIDFRTKTSPERESAKVDWNARRETLASLGVEIGFFLAATLPQKMATVRPG